MLMHVTYVKVLKGLLYPVVTALKDIKFLFQYVKRD
jgi:hypothetical protein